MLRLIAAGLANTEIAEELGLGLGLGLGFEAVKTYVSSILINWTCGTGSKRSCSLTGPASPRVPSVIPQAASTPAGRRSGRAQFRRQRLLAHWVHFLAQPVSALADQKLSINCAAAWGSNPRSAGGSSRRSAGVPSPMMTCSKPAGV